MLCRDPFCSASVRDSDMNCNKVIEALLAGLEKRKTRFWQARVRRSRARCAITVKKRMPGCCGLPEISGTRRVCGRSCRGGKPVSNVRIHGTVQKDESTWHAIYLHAGECGSVQEYPLILWKPEPEESDMESQ